VRALLPSSARKDGIALEGQLAHFQQLLEEGGDAEAAYLAEQLLVGQLHYLISMWAFPPHLSVRVFENDNPSADVAWAQSQDCV